MFPSIDFSLLLLLLLLPPVPYIYVLLTALLLVEILCRVGTE